MSRPDRKKAAQSFLEAARIVADLIENPESVNVGPKAVYSTSVFPVSNGSYSDTKSIAFSMTQKGAQAVQKIFEHMSDVSENSNNACEAFVLNIESLGMDVRLLKYNVCDVDLTFDTDRISFSEEDSVYPDDEQILVYPDWVWIRAQENDDNECRLVVYKEMIDRIAAGPGEDDQEEDRTGPNP